MCDEVKNSHTHAQTLSGPIRDTTLYIHKNPKGIGSNEDTILEQGYLFSVLHAASTLPLSSE